MTDPDPRSFLPLPPAHFHVLSALSAGELHGYAIMQEVEAGSDGVVKMGPATLYGTLKRLLDNGLIEELTQSPTERDDARRRYYRLTGLGASACMAEADRLSALARQVRTHLRPRTA